MRLAVTVVLTCGLFIGVGGCRHETIRPMPGRMPSEGALLRVDHIPIGGGFVFEEREILDSPLWNDFYPFNVRLAEPIEPLVGQLLVVRNLQLEFVDWARMTSAHRGRSGQVSPSGERILFERPFISDRHDDFPRAEHRDVRPCATAIYSKSVGRSILLEGYSVVYSAGRANHWRQEEDLTAFTSQCGQVGKTIWGLVVASYGGTLVLHPENNPMMSGLEFIAWSPDGQQIAALHSNKPFTDGEGGGVLVEVTLADGSARGVAEISADLAADNLGRFDRLIRWDADGLHLVD